ncbi:component of SufBCD complex [Palleronia sp. KMU-117]|uniref:component of SufBCD complex n=1 Tax=Palleronia sp. KMU-117 TaxID=3434108 RepID=UPI003D732B01
MQWYETIFELIDMRSFSNLWYWIALAVLWSTVSHWVLGVPFDMVQRARRQGGEAEGDLRDLVRINVNRIVYIADTAGVFIIGAGCAAITALVLLGFWYGIEFAQALFLLIFPTAIVGALSLRQARRLRATSPEGEALFRALNRHRFWTQVIGVISIFVTALWGMWQNMTIGVLGG